MKTFNQIKDMWWSTLKLALFFAMPIDVFATQLSTTNPIATPVPTGNIKVQLQQVVFQNGNNPGSLFRIGLVVPTAAHPLPNSNTKFLATDRYAGVFRINVGSGVVDKIVDIPAILASEGRRLFEDREGGILSVAVHPKYSKNGKFYTVTAERPLVLPTTIADADVDVTSVESDLYRFNPGWHVNVLREWVVENPLDTDAVPIVNTVSRKVLSWEFTIGDHQGGDLKFDNAGLLYVAVGGGEIASGTDFTLSGTLKQKYQALTPNQPIPANPVNYNGSFTRFYCDVADEPCYIIGGKLGVSTSQDTGNFLGSVLRIDPDKRTSENGQYGVPANNPFVSNPTLDKGGQAGCDDGQCDEIFAYGLRNPWKIVIDQNDLFITDVGQLAAEEINKMKIGGQDRHNGVNFGWPLKEGTFCHEFPPFYAWNGNTDVDGLGNIIAALDFRASTDVIRNLTKIKTADECVNPNLRDPLAQYDHSDGAAVIGGAVYSGSDIPGANGKLIVADINLSTANPLTYRIFAVNKDNGDIEKLDVRNVPTGYAAQGVFGGNDGEVYVMGQDSLRNGVIYKLVPFIE